MKELMITENECEQRLDRFLSKYFKNTSRANLYKLIRKKVFKVNGVRVKEDYFLKKGDLLQIYLNDQRIEEMQTIFEAVMPEKIGLDIVFEDDAILVVNKPKGMLTHPDKDEYKNTLATHVQYYLKALCTPTFRPAPVHRLDKNTSGLVIFAKTYDALKRYNALMRDRKIEKYYMCIVEGHVSRSGEVQGYLMKDELSNKVTLLKTASDASKFCHTLYKPLSVFGDYTLMEIQLLTGRSHQIRVSMQYIGHPIVGDRKYGAKIGMRVENQLLHSHKVVVEGRTFEAHSQDIDDFLSQYKR